VSASSRAHPRSRRRPPAGVTAASIRIDVRLTRDEGFSKYFAAWGELARWLESPAFTGQSDLVSSIRVIHVAAQADASGLAGGRGDRQ
jgi:hypothetical protein